MTNLFVPSAATTLSDPQTDGYVERSTASWDRLSKTGSMAWKVYTLLAHLVDCTFVDVVALMNDLLHV